MYIFEKEILFLSNEVNIKMLNSKIYLSWILVFFLSLFIASCGGGGGGGSATPPPVNGSGNGGNGNGGGNGDQCASGQTLQNGQCVAQRINEAEILNQIRALTGRIQELETNKVDNEEIIADLRGQIANLTSQITTLRGTQDTNETTIADLREQITELENQVRVLEFQNVVLSDETYQFTSTSTDAGGVLFLSNHDDSSYNPIEGYRYHIIALDKNSNYSLDQLRKHKFNE